MAINKVTSATSVLTTANADNAFDNDSAVADTLIVDVGAFLIAQGSNADGALLANTGAWTVTVNGSIFSQQSAGIDLASGNAAASTITIGTDGEVGGATGIAAFSSATINNSGLIAGANFG